MMLRNRSFTHAALGAIGLFCLGASISGCGSSSGDDTPAPGAGAGAAGGSSGAGGASAGGAATGGSAGGAAGTGIGGKGGTTGVGGAAAGTSGAGGAQPMPMDDAVWGLADTVCPGEPPDSTAPALLGRDCDPIDPELCGFPFPSNVYLADSTTTPSMKTVAFGKTTLPEIAFKDHIDASEFGNRDGFSPGTPILAVIPGATATGLADSVHIGDSIAVDASNKPTSSTIILDTSTGKLVEHWAEIDESSNLASKRAFMIRAAKRLSNQTRYIVAIRHVVDNAGNVIPPSPFFKSLRDGTADCSPALMTGLRADLYKDIFTQLAAAGVDKSDLQMAWDFSTGSRKSITQDIVAMRDEAMAKYSTAKYKIYKVTEDPPDDFNVWKRIDLTVTLPLYLETANVWNTTADALPLLHRGTDGLPEQNGEFDYPLVIHVPQSAKTAAAGSHSLIQYGHGLFGDRYEGSGVEFDAPSGRAFLTHFANAHQYIAFATDFMGFASTTDITGATNLDDSILLKQGLSGDPKYLFSLFERQEQGQLNQLLMMRFMIKVASQGLVDDTGTNVLDGTVIDPTKRFYQGDSQGGIMGGSYTALSTDVTRAGLMQGGAPYSLILNRSVDYPQYGLVLNSTYGDPRSSALVLGLAQMQWDVIEPDGYIDAITGNTLPCADAVQCPGGATPTHQVLLYGNVGDCQVTGVATDLVARTVGAQLLSPSPREIYGITDSTDIMGGSGVVDWDFGLPAIPATNTPPDSKWCDGNNDPHDSANRLDPALAQIDHFFQTGEITSSFCNNGGICGCFDADPVASCDKLPQPSYWMGSGGASGAGGSDAGGSGGASGGASGAGGASGGIGGAGGSG